MGRADYDHREIERFWQKNWQSREAYKVSEDPGKPKYYVLDMFPYPSGAGLHVGHPLGYIASDIVSRYKRARGFNVLHPMGFDAFGLPAEQYAIQTGKHPAETTSENILRYRQQLDRIGFAYDWSREVRTCEPAYYKWTQWIFGRFFTHWYNLRANRAEHIDNLIAIFENEGNVNVSHHGPETAKFTASEWLDYDKTQKELILQNYRLAYLAETTVNWCEALGTVLANEEVKDGLSERGGHPVVKKTMRQWFLRITAYADRLLEGLEKIDWSESIKEIQRNWIGRSSGASIHFRILNSDAQIEVFTTRPDTLFGSTFMVIAPEHELIPEIVSEAQRIEVETYVQQALNKTERERMSEVKQVSGVFSGAYCLHPFTGDNLPVYIADYVLGGYGTGAIMAVPAHDSRDHAFARHFGLPIVQVVDDPAIKDVQTESFDSKEGTMINSDFLNGLHVSNAIDQMIKELGRRNIGEGRVNYKLRDAGFGRQRYWGEPFPIIYQNGTPTLIPSSELPVRLPDVQSYKPTGSGASPLASAHDWVHTPSGERETDTMPGWAGSSWYFLRYMDPQNRSSIADPDKIIYWGQVDLYMGGAEHATGHLLYARFWTKFLFDTGILPFDEPFAKLINQGMIQGVIENICLRKEKLNGSNYFKSYELIRRDGEEDLYTKLPVSISIVQDYGKDSSYIDKLGILKFIEERPDFSDAIFETVAGTFNRLQIAELQDNSNFRLETRSETGKMSKRWGNVVNPDDVCEDYGADALRLYEMFLGPLEDSKPWNTHGIDGVYRFLRKLWKHVIDANGDAQISEAQPGKEALKSLHKCIRKITEDIEKYSFNTAVSTFMICLNELIELKCRDREILEQFILLLAPFAPHISEELWSRMGHQNSVLDESWPEFNEQYLTEDSKVYPISINGKTRAQMEFPLDTTPDEIEKAVLAHETVLKWLDGKQPRKVIVVPGRIVNVVI
ncbi:MAG: leucine--tRNA ligase [Flavobacteriales bacterium]|nr:leucine--tRNA ligase [Flavobacteriales bacterium]